MEPNVDFYQPSRLYSRAGWAALAGSLVSVLCGLRAPLAFIPAGLLLLSSGALWWLASRPSIRISLSQFSVGQRAIAWREVREINSRFTSPLVLRLKLTNSRRKTLVFPGEPERIARLMYQLRRNSYLASFDGVSYRDYWLWTSLTESDNEENGLGTPVRMLSTEDEQDVERIFQKLKAVDRSDSSKDDATTNRD
jgi:hypothetical protein